MTMDIWMSLLGAVILAAITAVIGYGIGWSKKKGHDIMFEDIYAEHKLFFDVAGQMVKDIDEKLYKELEEAILAMKTAYESPAFTTEAFQEIIMECGDVFERAKEIIK